MSYATGLGRRSFPVAKERAASLDRIGQLAGGPADVANAVVPWLCVTAFRRLCSEQRAAVIGPYATAPRVSRTYATHISSTRHCRAKLWTDVRASLGPTLSKKNSSLSRTATGGRIFPLRLWHDSDSAEGGAIWGM